MHHRFHEKHIIFQRQLANFNHKSIYLIWHLEANMVTAIASHNIKEIADCVDLH